MYQKDNCELKIDLVFKSNNLSDLSDKFINKSDNLIFEASFWEEVFCCWIKTILYEKKNFSFPSFIFEKKIFSLSLQITDDNEISTSIHNPLRGSFVGERPLHLPIESESEDQNDENSDTESRRDSIDSNENNIYVQRYSLNTKSIE